MAKYSKLSKELKGLMIQIRDKKLLGRGYSKRISEQLQISQSQVLNVTSGISAKQEVVEVIIQIAEKSRGIIYEPLPQKEINYSEQELKEKLLFIRENDLLPRNYGRIISDELGCTMARVRQVSNLVFFNTDIAKAIVYLVENSKEKELINRAKMILEKS